MFPGYFIFGVLVVALSSASGTTTVVGVYMAIYTNCIVWCRQQHESSAMRYEKDAYEKYASHSPLISICLLLVLLYCGGWWWRWRWQRFTRANDRSAKTTIMHHIKHNVRLSPFFYIIFFSFHIPQTMYVPYSHNNIFCRVYFYEDDALL